MLPVINILGLPLPVGPISVLLAFYLGVELAERVLENIAPDDRRAAWRMAFGRAAFIGLVAGLVGGRLGYAVRYYQLYLESPELLLSLRPGTLAMTPGLLVGGAVALFYLWRKQLSLTKIIDAVAIGATGSLLILSLGDFLTGNAYGAPTDVPWGIELWNATRHPVQLYEAAALLIILVVLWSLHQRLIPSETFWRFVMLYSLSRLFLEVFHAYSVVWGPGIRIIQVMALVTLLLSLFVLSHFAACRERMYNQNLDGHSIFTGGVIDSFPHRST